MYREQDVIYIDKAMRRMLGMPFKVMHTANSDVPWSVSRCDVDLSMNFEFTRSTVTYKSPDLVSTLFQSLTNVPNWLVAFGRTRSDTNTSPLCSNDICGFDGPPLTGNSTTGESLWKRKGSSGSAATKEQFGEPNLRSQFQRRRLLADQRKGVTHVHRSDLSSGKWVGKGGSRSTS